MQQLSQLTIREVWQFRNVGQVTFDELTALLHRHGLDWRWVEGDQPRMYRESDMREAFEFGLGLYADDNYFPAWIAEYRKGMNA